MEFAIFVCQLLLIVLAACALAFVLAMSTVEGRREFRSFRARRRLKRKLENLDWGRMVTYSQADVRATLIAMRPAHNRSIFDQCVEYHGFNPLSDNHTETL